MKLVPGRGPHRQAPRGRHAVAQLLAETIDAAVVGAHALAHDARRDADHVRVADPPALDDADDRAPRVELALRAAGRRGCRRRRARARPALPAARWSSAAAASASIDRQVATAPALAERLLEAGGDLRARPVGDQRHALAGLDRQAGLDGIARARRADRAAPDPKVIDLL